MRRNAQGIPVPRPGQSARLRRPVKKRQKKRAVRPLHIHSETRPAKHPIQNKRNPQHQVLAAAASMGAYNPANGFMFPGPLLAGQAQFGGRPTGSNQTLIRVQFEKLAFYEYQAELNSPIRLLGANPNSRPLTHSFSFSLNTEQINEILNHRSLHAGKFEHAKQVHLRFGFYEQAAQRDTLPANLVVNVNQKPAQLPTPKPTSKPNADIVRPGRSIDVTHLIRLAPNMANKVDLNWTNVDANKTHCVGVYFFRKVTVKCLIDFLKANKTIDGELTKKMVRQKLQISDMDFEIETNYYKVSLQCPLMKFRIQIPSRAVSCKHIQCFDLESYLMMNEKKPTWLCPVCDQHTPFDSLFIDALFQDILKKCPDIEDVQFNADAEWSVVKPSETAGADKSGARREETKASPSKSTDSPTNNIDTSLVDICENDSMDVITSKQEKFEAPIAEPKKSNTKEVVIDLTLDSDDEDTPAASASVAASNLPLLKQSASMSHNQSNNESLTETEGALSPSVSIISLSSSESGSPRQSSQSDPNKTRTPTSAGKKPARNASHQQSPVSSDSSNGSHQGDTLMHASEIINTPPASINSESYNSRMAKDISSPKRTSSSTVEPKQTSSLSSVESILNTAKNASNYIQQQQQHQSKNAANRPSQPAHASQQRTSSSNRHHSLVGSSNKIQKPSSSRHDYLNKEKVHLINEQVRSSRSPNINEMEPSAIYRLKDTNISGNFLSSQMSRMDSEMGANFGHRKNMDNRGSYQGQSFFLNNKPMTNGINMNHGNPSRSNGANKLNHPNMNYNSGQRLPHHPYQIPPGQGSQQYHSHPYT
ncbi:E3 SUMO- ligase PIAS2-like isoform X3 [Brachionus plicatilis]|uniref:E3 SUMO-ligase PIAS2-like isoform X3 n=1 Tax=Brachionus plicatilis TaxID=10195 RepID=A0A3M7T577_BRAPC|nr:E3 SUMO- ligase PIAS2-like isoform X3 [Brachionus plicatilis]